MRKLPNASDGSAADAAAVETSRLGKFAPGSGALGASLAGRRLFVGRKNKTGQAVGRLSARLQVVLLVAAHFPHHFLAAVIYCYGISIAPRHLFPPPPVRGSVHFRAAIINFKTAWLCLLAA